MKFIKLSFIIPVYNAEKYLSRCIDSLLYQNINEIEIITINDGSTDSSLSILNSYKQKYPEVFTIISEENQGIGPARNLGLSIAKGEYIWFIDNDDCIRPNCLNQLYNILKESECDILDIGFSHSQYSINPLQELSPSTLINYEIRNQKYAFFFKEDPPWSKIYLHTFLTKAITFFPNFFGEDTSVVYWLYAKASKICEVNEIFYAWYNRPSSFSNSVLTSKHLITIPKMFELLEQQRNQFPLLHEEFDFLILRKSKCFLDFYQNHTVDNIEIEKERLQLINKLESIIKSKSFNFYQFLSTYITKSKLEIENKYNNPKYSKFTQIFGKIQRLINKILTNRITN